NGWVRDTAHQFLAQGQYRMADLEVASKAVKELARNSPIAQARLHAIYAQNAMPGGRDYGEGGNPLRDSHPAIRIHALSLLEGLPFTDIDAAALDKLETDSNAQVRQQLAYSLGYALGVEADTERLVRLLRHNADNPFILAAGLSSITDRNYERTFKALM